MNEPKKSLGQHWLTDKATLSKIVSAAEISANDTVLEIGPGLGHMTELLSEKAGQVIAVELDSELAVGLITKKLNNVQVVEANILEFDLTSLPAGYKAVANIPYYLTSNLIRVLSESPNPPTLMVLLVQKEVAQRIAATPGSMSLLSVSAQLHYEPSLGLPVLAELFTPPPKVDSQVIILKRRAEPIFPNLDEKRFFRIVKAGFASRRKKLRSSLAAGLHFEKRRVDELLEKAHIDGNRRAQELSLQDWHNLAEVVESH